MEEMLPFLTNLDLIIFLRNKKVLTYQIVIENSFLACIMHFDKKKNGYLNHNDWRIL
jgi:hypothetical protein